MTLWQFLEVLAQTRNGIAWKQHMSIDHVGLRQAGEKCLFCPITAVANKIAGVTYDVSDWALAADRICLDLKTAKAIVRAADTSYGYKKRLRKLLLKATGVQSNVCETKSELEVRSGPQSQG